MTKSQLHFSSSVQKFGEKGPDYRRNIAVPSPYQRRSLYTLTHFGCWGRSFLNTKVDTTFQQSKFNVDCMLFLVEETENGYQFQ
jgi:hypothetical protein